MAEKKMPGGKPGTGGAEYIQDTTLCGDSQAVIPSEIRDLEQWVAWKSVPEYDQKTLELKPKHRKVPVNVKSEKGALPNNPSTWCYIDRVMEFIDEWAGEDHTHIDGKGAEITGTVSEYPGFMFHPDDGYVGIDIDGCRDPATGQLTPRAATIVEMMDSYTEVSPSGTGIHILIKGVRPDGFKFKDDSIGVECYDRGRYFTVTGQVIQGRGIIWDRQKKLEKFLDKYLSKKAKPEGPDPLNGADFFHSVDAKTVLKRALKSKKGPVIQALLNGENAGQPSDSEGDMSLCNSLVFFCGHIPDADVCKIVDSIVRDSKRMRDKWDEIHRPDDGFTYGMMTIEKAIEDTTKRYQTHTQRVLSDTQDLVKILDRIGRTIDDIIGIAYDGQAGCRELFIDIYRGRYCFDHAAGAWYEFRGHAWTQEKIQKVISECDVLKRLFERADAELGGRIIELGQELKNADGPAEATTIEAQVKEAEAKQKVVRGIIKSLNTLGFRKQVVEFAAVGDFSLGITGDEWDRLPWHLACGNGVLDLKTGKLRPGKPDDYLKAVCPTDYKPEAVCPQYDRALLDIFGGSAALVSFIRRMFGLSLVGVNLEHKLFVLWGTGRNGKDTLLKAKKVVLGDDLAGEIRSEMLLDQGRMRSSSGPSADIMRLRGLRLAWGSETNEGRRMDAGQVKLLTGGGDLVGRPPYGRREVSFPQSFSLFLLTNAKPQASAEDYALWKRIVLVPFNTKFVDDPQGKDEKLIDRFLDDKLAAEAEGILSWMVRGCLEWQRDGLQPPDVVTQATDDYRAAEDVLQQFIDDGCIVHKDASCKAGRLYKHYVSWMTDNGLKPMTGTLFGRKMGERFEKVTDRSGTLYKGVGIVTNDFIDD